jgi:hypothetical protein
MSSGRRFRSPKARGTVGPSGTERHLHHHGYTWLGEKRVFDIEALRRPPHPDPPPRANPGDLAAQRLGERYREVIAEFTVTGVPPIQTAHWLMKPPTAVQGTWTDPVEAGRWLVVRLDEISDRLAVASERTADRRARLVSSALERLSWGGDVSLGHYVVGTQFHSLAVVTCSPNSAGPGLPCPLRQQPA